VSDIEPPVVRYSPVLVVDTDVTTAAHLVQQLQIRGCSADVAISCTAARAAAHAKHYRSLILIADMSRAADLACLATLRSRLPATWIIVIGKDAEQDAQNSTVRHCADALLTRPFSLDDLTFRLAAFSHRPRPR
jgi:DNA-binding response OmpR family regulator